MKLEEALFASLEASGFDHESAAPLHTGDVGPVAFRIAGTEDVVVLDRIVGNVDVILDLRTVIERTADIHVEVTYDLEPEPAPEPAPEPPRAIALRLPAPAPEPVLRLPAWTAVREDRPQKPVPRPPARALKRSELIPSRPYIVAAISAGALIGANLPALIGPTFTATPILLMLVEELIFRLILGRALTRAAIGALTSILTSAVLFGLYQAAAGTGLAQVAWLTAGIGLPAAIFQDRSETITAPILFRLAATLMILLVAT